MRKTLLGGAMALAALAGAACSQKAEQAAAPAGEGGARPASEAASPASAVTGALQPKRKAGLWRMSMSHTGGPGMSMTAEMCVDEASAGDFNFDPGKRSKDCTNSKLTPTGNGWAFESICKMDGRTVTTQGTVTGDMSSNYAMQASTRMEPAPEGMPATSDTKIEAKWIGACPPGMKPGAVKVAGMNIGG
jgi:hypothetical protein